MAGSTEDSCETRILKVQPQADPRSYKLSNAVASHPGFHITQVCYYDGMEALNDSYRHDVSPLVNLSSRDRKRGRTAYWKLGQIGVMNPLSAKVIERRLREVAKDDSSRLIHTNGAPDVFGYLAKKGSSLPVVHEIYDTYSLYDSARDRRIRLGGTRNPLILADRRLQHRLNMRWERYVHEHADALVFTSQEMLDKSKELYGDMTAIVVPNGVLKRDLPEHRLDKLSLADGRIHCVYTGALRAGLTHRMIVPQIRQLTKHKDFVLHLYSTSDDATYIRSGLERLIAGKKVILHKPLHYADLYRELTKYDLGVVLLNPGNTELLDVALPNKVFEYVAAGLPVAAPPYKSLSNFLSMYSCGFTVRDWHQDIIANISNLREVDHREEFTIDFHIPSLLKLYRTVV